MGGHATKEYRVVGSVYEKTVELVTAARRSGGRLLSSRPIARFGTHTSVWFGISLFVWLLSARVGPRSDGGLAKGCERDILVSQET